MRNIVISFLFVFCFLSVGILDAAMAKKGPIPPIHGADTKIPVKGKTLLKGTDQWDAMRLVYGAARNNNSCIGYLSVADTKVTVDKKDNSWTETWSIKGCADDGKNIDIPIKITENLEKKTIMYEVMMLKIDYRENTVTPMNVKFEYTW